MKTIKVQYQVNKDYVEQNKSNIRAVMAEVLTINKAGVSYEAYCCEDGQTFIHLLTVENDEDASIVPNTQAFQIFRKQLAQGLIAPPVNETICKI